MITLVQKAVNFITGTSSSAETVPRPKLCDFLEVNIHNSESCSFEGVITSVDGSDIVINHDIYYTLPENEGSSKLGVGERVCGTAQRTSEGDAWRAVSVQPLCQRTWDEVESGKLSRGAKEDRDGQPVISSHALDSGIQGIFRHDLLSTKSKVSKGPQGQTHTQDDPTPVQRDQQGVGKVTACFANSITVNDTLNFTISPSKCDFELMKGDWISYKVTEESTVEASARTGVLLAAVEPLRRKCVRGDVTRVYHSHFIVDDEVYCPRSTIGKNTVAVDDTLMVTLIESDQGNFCWRAIAVAPTIRPQSCWSPHRVPQTLAGSSSGIGEDKVTQLLENKCGVIVSKSLSFSTVGLGHTSYLTAFIKNIGNEMRTLHQVYFVSTSKDCQFSVDNNMFNNGGVIKVLPDKGINVRLQCNAKFVGASKQLCVFDFQTFQIGRYVSATVEDKCMSMLAPSTPYIPRLHHQTQRVSDGQIIRGQKPFKPQPFLPVSLPSAEVPPRLWQAIGEGTDLLDIVPNLAKPLTPDNHLEKLKALLYLEEIAMTQYMRQFDMERSSLSRLGDYLSLVVPGLAERRPSLMVGDKVLVATPGSGRDVEYEGYVHEVQHMQVLLKFHPTFQEEYAGEDYAIRFQFNRTPLRRCHFALAFCQTQLGKDILFPTKMKIQLPQVAYVDPNVTVWAKDQRVKELGKKTLCKDKDNNIRESGSKQLTGQTVKEQRKEWDYGERRLKERFGDDNKEIQPNATSSAEDLSQKLQHQKSSYHSKGHKEFKEGHKQLLEVHPLHSQEEESGENSWDSDGSDVVVEGEITEGTEREDVEGKNFSAVVSKLRTEVNNTGDTSQCEGKRGQVTSVTTTEKTNTDVSPHTIPKPNTNTSPHTTLNPNTNTSPHTNSSPKPNTTRHTPPRVPVVTRLFGVPSPGSSANTTACSSDDEARDAKVSEGNWKGKCMGINQLRKHIKNNNEEGNECNGGGRQVDDIENGKSLVSQKEYGNKLINQVNRCNKELVGTSSRTDIMSNKTMKEPQLHLDKSEDKTTINGPNVTSHQNKEDTWTSITVAGSVNKSTSPKSDRTNGKVTSNGHNTTVKHPRVDKGLPGVVKGTSRKLCRNDWTLNKPAISAGANLRCGKEQYCIPVFPLNKKGSTRLSNVPTLRWINPRLNSEQRLAVRRVLEGATRPLPYIIYGPPGTGKTLTLVEAALQLLKMIPHSRLLIVTPSNSASDLIAERLVKSNHISSADIVRLNAFHRQQDSIPSTIQHLSCNGDSLHLHVHQRIVVTTATTSGLLYTLGLHVAHFTHVFVDEAGQLTEPECLLALGLVNSKSGQVVLAGDPEQLGPVVISRTAKRFGLDQSLLARLCCSVLYKASESQGEKPAWEHEPQLVTHLVRNYRSHPDIIEVPSQLFYQGRLVACADEKERSCMLSWPQLPSGSCPMLFHGVISDNLQEADSPSWFNPAEAFQAVRYAKNLVEFGVNEEDIGIITPYRKQVEKIRLLKSTFGFGSEIKVGSVEEFQGQERVVIIISTVRSTQDLLDVDIGHSLGFVKCRHRFNVAVTRAKSLLIIVGNPRVLAQDKNWQELISFCVLKGAYYGPELEV